jgi:signal transduction histidine kinase
LKLNRLFHSDFASSSAQHHIWRILGLVTMLMLVAGGFAIWTVSRQVKEQLRSHLQLILTGTSSMLQTTIDSLIQQVEALPSYEDITPRETDPALLEQRIMRRLSFPVPLGLVMTHSDGSIFHASDEGLAGSIARFTFTAPPGGVRHDVRMSEPMILGNYGKDKGDANTYVIALTIPLGDLGLWILYDARRIFSPILQPGRSGTTGEIYAFKHDGVMISDSRFNEQLVRMGLLKEGEEASGRLALKDPGINMMKGERAVSSADRQPLTQLVRAALASPAGMDLAGYRDYRGTPVVGAWEWLPQYGFGLAHEMDKDEAYSNVHTIIGVVAFLAGLLLCLTLMSWLFSWRLIKAEREMAMGQKRLKELQETIAHFNRLASLGEMATSIAHEINQPLLAISNYARSLIIATENPEKFDLEKFRARLIQIEANALRSGEVIHRLRRFVSHRTLKMEPMPVDRILQDPLALVATELKAKGIRVNVQRPEPLPQVMGDEILLQQVVLNLFRNSIDAMRKVARPGHALDIAVQHRADANRLVLSIGDTGPGFDRAIRHRIFENFNSSSPANMGMGLAISRSIIEGHGGHIEITRDSADGVTFEIGLPIQD